MLSNELHDKLADWCARAGVGLADAQELGVIVEERRLGCGIDHQGLSLLQHTLGLRVQRFVKRNYFCAGVADEQTMERLVSAGFCVKTGTDPAGNILYRATEKGAAMVGLPRRLNACY